MLILLDNAKCSGNPSLAEGSTLAPLYQCCIVRVSTWNRLNYLKNGVLKSALKTAMSHDPISPVLSAPHMDALDQRLLNIPATVKQCTDHGSPLTSPKYNLSPVAGFKEQAVLAFVPSA
uniref:FAM20 C-terminal domain-containing protein n=1 Tax=Varanus komodoensis TaxID=61221 RepID=A0A8D2J816_VARKO